MFTLKLGKRRNKFQDWNLIPSEDPCARNHQKMSQDALIRIIDLEIVVNVLTNKWKM